MRICITASHLFIPGSPPVENAETLNVWLEALIGTNRVFLSHHPRTPKLYDAGVIYARTDDWESIPDLYRESYHGTDRPECRVPKRYGRFGDCKSLACARIAELRAAGKQAKPNFRFDIKPIIAPRGSLILPNGSIVSPNGAILSADGSIAANGIVLDPSGRPRERLLYHILVQTGMNEYEDPSKVCGMTDNEWAYM